MSLFQAVVGDQLQLVKSLLAGGADVNQIDGISESTPLQQACQNSTYATVVLLVENGAELFAKDIWGQDVLVYANWNATRDKQNIVKYITQQMDLARVAGALRLLETAQQQETKLDGVSKYTNSLLGALRGAQPATIGEESMSVESLTRVVHEVAEKCQEIESKTRTAGEQVLAHAEAALRTQKQTEQMVVGLEQEDKQLEGRLGVLWREMEDIKEKRVRCARRLMVVKQNTRKVERQAQQARERAASVQAQLRVVHNAVSMQRNKLVSLTEQIQTISRTVCGLEADLCQGDKADTVLPSQVHLWALLEALNLSKFNQSFHQESVTLEMVADNPSLVESTTNPLTGTDNTPLSFGQARVLTQTASLIQHQQLALQKLNDIKHACRDKPKASHLGGQVPAEWKNERCASVTAATVRANAVARWTVTETQLHLMNSVPASMRTAVGNAVRENHVNGVVLLSLTDDDWNRLSGELNRGQRATLLKQAKKVQLASGVDNTPMSSRELDLLAQLRRSHIIQTQLKCEKEIVEHCLRVAQRQGDCLVCLEPSRSVLSPCGHVCCESCAGSLSPAVCPSCRSPFEATNRLFLN